MLPSADNEVERRVKAEVIHHTSRPPRDKKINRSSAAKGHRHQVSRPSRPPQPPKRKDKVKNKETLTENLTQSSEPAAPEGEAKVASTVVNVDMVREKEEQHEEFLGLLESGCQEEGVKPRNMGVCEFLLLVLVVTVVILLFPLSIWFCLQIVREHERAMIFRFGHLLQRKPRGPGLIFTLPFLDVCHKIDIRLKMLKVPTHTVVTKDLVSTELSAVCYYRIENLFLCYASLAMVPSILEGLMQVSNKEILAHHTFTEILLDRKMIAQKIQVSLDSAVCIWGIKVERADIEDIYLPPELQHNFAIEAEAKRQAHIKVIAAEGERAACEALRASTDALSGSPGTLQLRLLQLLHSLQTERSSLVLNLPRGALQLPTDLPSLPNIILPPVTMTQQSPVGDASDSPMM
ncbi:podocin [Alosa pseudoharengus]|uniref:podocin n=1 Tax=Alosa pseudoharengus TaxID=34774 RepID=UPI003F8C8CB3